MIYLDNAATTYPKPPSVPMAVSDAFRRYGANPGRGGHSMAMASAEQVFACREEAARLFGAADPLHVVFTAGCTASLNTVIHGLLGGGGAGLLALGLGLALAGLLLLRGGLDLPAVGSTYDLLCHISSSYAKMYRLSLVLLSRYCGLMSIGFVEKV